MCALLRNICAAGAALLGLGATIASTTATAAQPAGVISRDDVTYGKTYGDWAAAWYQWAVSLPAGNHPLFDTARDCGKGQSGPVFFLGGKFCSSTDPSCVGGTASRSCVIPRGRALFFPILNAGCNSREAEIDACPPARPIVSEMRRWATDIMQPANGFSVSLDGQPINANFKRDFRVQPPLFDVIVPDFPKGQNLYQAIGEAEVGPGRYFTTDDGVYVMLEPLPSGTHTLNFKGSLPQFGFTLDISYALTVK